MMRAKVNAIDLADAVGQMYKAALGQQTWTHALQTLANTGLGQNAHIFSITTRDTVPFQVAFNLAPEGMQQYADHYVQICPRVKFLSRHPGKGIYFDYQFTNQKEMRRSEYHDWLEKASVGPFFVGSVLAHEDNEQYLLSMHRSRKAGHVEAADIRLFNMLQGHLSQALRMGRQFGQAHGEVLSFQELARNARGPTLILGQDGSIVYANDAASSILRRRDALLIEAGKLAARFGADNDALKAALSCAGSMDMRRPSDSPPTLVRGAGGQSFLVRMVPLPTFSIFQGGPRVHYVGVFITEGWIGAAHSSHLHGLTAAETSVALLLCQGGPLKRVASELQISYNTARKHLANAMRKTNTHRQIDLLRIIQGIDQLPKSP